MSVPGEKMGTDNAEELGKRLGVGVWSGGVEVRRGEAV
jgi:hypothetical protein